MSERPLILVVDDDAPILLLMRSILREYGFDAITAASGPEAIEQARTHKPSLMLLDRNMPGMSGDEVLHQLRAEGTLNSLPVLILSGEPIDAEEVRRIGATGAVLKPFDVPVLIETIRSHSYIKLRAMIHDRPDKLTNASIDDLAYTAVFSADAATKAEARRQIHLQARQRGAISSSIYPLYQAIGRGEVSRKFTVPAFNIRSLTYDVARALFRAAMRHDVGAFIFEIARSEIGYTEQRPGEYAACVLAAAIAEGYKGPVFIQGDHFQASAKKWATPDGKQSEIKALESLIDEAIAAEFYNIDIDTSTLVDLSFPTRDEQQRENYTYTAHFTKYIRERQPAGIDISIGGEIGEVGKYNTQPDEVRAYIDGVKRALGGDPGMAKISVQTGTSHGGVPMPDGTIAEAKIDFDVLRETTRICRSEYGIAGSVQHGASTLPEEVFNKFPENDAVEIHLATGFQNMILDAETLPAEMKSAIRDFCFANCADERKSGETDEQFVYKTRKKALGPFKQQLWELPESGKGPILEAMEQKFEFLMDKLAVFGTRDLVTRHVPLRGADLPEYAAASAELTAAATVDPNEGE